MGLSLFGPNTPKTLDGPFVPHTVMPSHEGPAPLLKFQNVPRFSLVTSSGSKKRDPNITVPQSAR